MFKRAFVVFAKLLLFIAVVWLVVMAYWKHTDHVVSSEDLLIYFLILPVGLLLAFYLFRLLRWLTAKIYRRIHAPVNASVATGTTQTQATPQRIEQTAPTYVLATATATYFGNESAMTMDAILHEKRRAEVHAEFTQELGYGVRVAEVDALEVAAHPAGARQTLLRTLALLESIYAPLGQVLSQAAPNPESSLRHDKHAMGVQLHPEWSAGATYQAAKSESIAGATPSWMPASLKVHIVLPPFLSLPEIRLVESEVTTWLQTVGWTNPAMTLLPMQPENEVEYLRHLQAWQQQICRNPSKSEWLLILSAVSWLDVDLLNDRLQKDTLFADRLARGGALIGEVACGMVLSSTVPNLQLELDPLMQLSLITLAQRDKPVDAKGTIEAALLNAMLADQKTGWQEGPTPVVGLAVSGDLNSGRAVELGRWVTDALPELDFIEDVLNVSEHVGDCGACGSVLALILTSAMAHEREGKALYCANQHASWRALAVVQPMHPA